MRLRIVVVAVWLQACGGGGGSADVDAGRVEPEAGPVAPEAGPVAPEAGPGAPEAGSDAAPAPAVCPVTDFVPCGGDVAGTWRVVDFCPEDEAAAQALCESPFSDRAECASAPSAARCRFLRDVTYELAADGVLRIRGETRIAVSYHFEDACLAAVGTTCAALGTARLTCTAAPAGCDCTSVTEPEPSSSDVPYVVDGSTLVFGDGPERATGAFCVAGDRLTIDVSPHPVSWRYWVLAR